MVSESLAAFEDPIGIIMYTGFNKLNQTMNLKLKGAPSAKNTSSLFQQLMIMTKTFSPRCEKPTLYLYSVKPKAK